MTIDPQHPIYPLLQELRKRDPGTIDAISNRSEEESLYLDFKQKTDSANSGLSSEDKGNLGKSLSGFSNSDGGIVIWGIKNRRKNDRDVAGAIDPIVQLEDFVSVLRDLSVKWLAPRNSKIEVFGISTEEDPSRGFAIVVIPKGESRPYQNRGPNEKGFYQKTSSNIVELEYFQIADLFSASRTPALDARFVVSDGGWGQGVFAEYMLEIWVTNSGPLPAERPFVWVSQPAPMSWANVNPFSFPASTYRDGRTKLYPHSDFLLFPDEEICVARLKFHSKTELGRTNIYYGSAPNPQTNSNPLLFGKRKLELWFGAKNAYRKHIEVVLDGEDLLKPPYLEHSHR